jgi:hypothetical protein
MGARGRARRLRMEYLRGRDAAEELLRQTRIHRAKPASVREGEPAPQVANPYPENTERWLTWRTGFLSRLDPMGGG